MEDSSNKGPLQVSAKKRTEVLFVARSVKAKNCWTYLVSLESLLR